MEEPTCLGPRWPNLLHSLGGDRYTTSAASIGSRIRDELLSGDLFETLGEAQVLVEECRIDYDAYDHSALGIVAPARFAACWRRSGSVKPRLSLAVDR